MIGGIVLTHGKIGAALIQAAETILGEVDNIYDLSTTSLALQDINAKMKQIIASQNWDTGIIIMVSLIGGSCWNSAVGLSRQLQNIEVIAGVNLSMLISFLTKRDRYSVAELAEIIKEDGKRGIDRPRNS